jgi:membrane-bound ClpP family serine protease
MLLRALFFIFICFSLHVFADDPPLISPTLLQRLQEHIKFDPNGPNHIGHLIISEEKTTQINTATWLYVKSALDHYKETKPIFIILELNTPGGEVYAAEKISDALKEMDAQYNIPIVAYINNWAVSAGAMLAYSSRFIVTAKDGIMGAAEPVTQNLEGKLEETSEKVNSALRADFSSRASYFGRNPDIAEAMVDKDVILVWRDNHVVRLGNENQIIATDTVITPKGKLLTLNADQLMKYGVADLLLEPHSLDLITAAERDKGEWPAAKTLLFTNAFFKAIPQTTVKSYQMDWKTRFFTILANPMVASLLFLGLMLGFYIEMSTPGFGVAGTIGVTCLFLILLSSFAMEAINWLEIILFVVGAGIILADLFVLPTFGLLGFVGTVFMVAGLFGLMVPGINAIDFEIDTQTFNAAGEAAIKRLGWLSATLVLAIAIMALLGRYVLPRFTPFNRFVLAGNEQDASAGYIAGENPSQLPQPGSKGKAVSTLRPSGKIMVNGTIYDAMTAGDFIEKDAAITVVRLEGSVIIVDNAR